MRNKLTWDGFSSIKLLMFSLTILNSCRLTNVNFFWKRDRDTNFSKVELVIVIKNKKQELAILSSWRLTNTIFSENEIVLENFQKINLVIVEENKNQELAMLCSRKLINTVFFKARPWYDSSKKSHNKKE